MGFIVHVRMARGRKLSNVSAPHFHVDRRQLYCGAIGGQRMQTSVTNSQRRQAGHSSRNTPLECVRSFQIRSISPMIRTSSSLTSKSEEGIENNSPDPPPPLSPSIPKAYADLAKAKLSALVVATTAAGFVAAGPMHSTGAFASVLLGTALCSSSAAAMNQILEVERDRRMKRCATRPLVTGVLSTPRATAASVAWGMSGTALLYFGTDPVTTSLGVTNIVLYAGVYTALKPVSSYNTWVGAVVGAIPPVMGYTAAAAATTGTVSAATLLDPVSLTLAATLYCWQLPHFLALAYMYRTDYARGGFAMLPCHVQTGATSAEEASEDTSKVIVRYAWYLSAVPFASTALGVTSSMFALESVVLNAYALRMAYRFHEDRTNQNARKIFLTSLWYLPCTLMLFLLHSKNWDHTNELKSTETDPDDLSAALSQFVGKQIHAIRDRGRQLCVHERQASADGESAEACLVVMGARKSKHTLDEVGDVVKDGAIQTEVSQKE